MKLKGLKKLEKRLNKIVNLIEEDIKLKVGSSDECVVSQRKIYFQILRNIGADRDFMKNIKEIYPAAPHRSACLYSLLHEIGHFHNAELLEQEDKELRKQIMESKDNHAYFLLPAEKAATDWAVQHATDRRYYLAYLDMEIEKAMVKFIAKNMD